MKIIDQKTWSHVLIEDDGKWILTCLAWNGSVESDASIQLTTAEIERITTDQAYIESLLADLKYNRGKYLAREIKPAVWPEN